MKPLTLWSVSSEAVISAYVPGQHMLAREVVQVLQNSGSQMVV